MPSLCHPVLCCEWCRLSMSDFEGLRSSDSHPSGDSDSEHESHAEDEDLDYTPLERVQGHRLKRARIMADGPRRLRHPRAAKGHHRQGSRHFPQADRRRQHRSGGALHLRTNPVQPPPARGGAAAAPRVSQWDNVI